MKILRDDQIYTIEVDKDLNPAKEFPFDPIQAHHDWLRSMEKTIQTSRKRDRQLIKVYSLLLDPSILHLHQQFPLVFEDPATLPPKRSIDHKIPLLPGSKPINVRPYRYSHQHKNILERLVRELLDRQLIRPSTSLFASPALLVKKKEGA